MPVSRYARFYRASGFHDTDFFLGFFLAFRHAAGNVRGPRGLARAR